VSISTLAARNGLNGQTLRKQYKEKISDYRSWEQLEHAEEYMLFPNNFGRDMSLDETCLSNGEVYTILTNKAAHGGKGALAAMVRGVASNTVSEILRKVPRELRRRVDTVTTDLSSAMMLTVRNVFPKARLINDRFHVQQLMSEAIDQMRIAFRWVVLEEENKAIKEHRAKRKAAHTKAEKDLIGEWEPEKMKNGETKPQVMARSRHIILMHKSKWNNQQKDRADALFEMFPDLEKAYNLYLKLVDIFNQKCVPGVARLNLARWYNDVEAFGYDGFNKVIETFENHNETIINYFEDRITNASAESFNAKIKAFRTQFRGVGDIKFFMYRLATLYS
jgi:transposase